MIKFICILILIPYIIWQYKVVTKYGFKFDKLNIDIKNNLVTINNRKIKFTDINSIDVIEQEQPSNIERMLTKASYNYMADIVFYLKDGTTQRCVCNYKGIIYKSLAKLQPYIRINCDIEYFRPQGLPIYLVILMLILGTICIVFSLSH